MIEEKDLLPKSSREWANYFLNTCPNNIETVSDPKEMLIGMFLAASDLFAILAVDNDVARQAIHSTIECEIELYKKQI